MNDRMQSNQAISADTTPDDDRLWTVAQTAKFLNVSQRWVYRAVGNGEIPSFKLGGLVRFRPQTVREFAQALEAQAAGAAKVLRLAPAAARRGRGGR
jgi:excisionase family DNA binding protein